jgi:hypothetical protein
VDHSLKMDEAAKETAGDINLALKGFFEKS